MSHIISRIAVLLVIVVATGFALDAPLGVVAVPVAPGAQDAYGGSAVIIAPDRAVTLAEALPEKGEPTLRIAGVLVPATVLKRGDTSTAVLLGFAPPPGVRVTPIALADSTALRLGDQVVEPVLGCGVEDVLQEPVKRVGQVDVAEHLVEFGRVPERHGRVRSCQPWTVVLVP